MKRIGLLIFYFLMPITHCLASLVEVACPHPNTLIFEKTKLDYQVYGKLQILTHNYTPIPIVKGYALLKQVNQLKFVKWRRDYFACNYVDTQNNMIQMKLTKTPPLLFAYCYFIHSNDASNKICLGNEDYCTLRCEVL